MKKKRTRVYTGKPPKSDQSRSEQTRVARNSTLPGVLKPAQTEVPVAETIEEIPIAGIEPFRLIPDYKQPSASEIPTVVNCPAGVLCIDGGEAISKASSEGRSSALCRIFHIQEDNKIEIAIRKAAIRSKPSGGTCTYPEAIRNACMLFYLLLKSTANPVVLSHGGSRRGAGFISNPEDNVRSILADRLGKSSTTINKYLGHGEYLSAAVMNALVEADAGKDFFERAQKVKKETLSKLKSLGMHDAQITRAISRCILSWLKTFQQTGKIELAKPKGLNPWSGRPEPETDPANCGDDVRRQIKDLAMGLHAAADDRSLPLDQLGEVLCDQLAALARVFHELKQLSSQPACKEDQG
jgi:hypothetical protein